MKLEGSTRWRIVFDKVTREPIYMFEVCPSALVMCCGYDNGQPTRKFIMPNPVTYERYRKMFFEGKL